MLTKPAGVFAQLIGAIVILFSLPFWFTGATATGFFIALLGAGLMWLGRQTKKSGQHAKQ